MTNTAHVTPDPRPGERVVVTRPGRWHGTTGTVTHAVQSDFTYLWVYTIDTVPTTGFYADELGFDADELESDQP